jgi:DNA-binding XRE family transcriptional regulator
MNVKFQKTPQGEVAVLPRKDYEALIAKAAEADEDAGTARLVARARKEVAKGAPLIPLQVAERLAQGENPIQVLRHFRGYSQIELAAAIGITQGYLSDLEAGKRRGPFELHHKIARVLGVPFDLLVPIAVAMQKAEPARFARRKRVAAEMKRQRKR